MLPEQFSHLPLQAQVKGLGCFHLSRLVIGTFLLFQRLEAPAANFHTFEAELQGFWFPINTWAQELRTTQLDQSSSLPDFQEHLLLLRSPTIGSILETRNDQNCHQQKGAMPNTHFFWDPSPGLVVAPKVFRASCPLCTSAVHRSSSTVSASQTIRSRRRPLMPPRARSGRRLTESSTPRSWGQRPNNPLHFTLLVTSSEII